ncbi:flagellar hook-length control protein FliK [Psychrobacillus sp. NPDC058041]|uniref:flagellar hook-length control protein FliK n=1 Tax=Psychrobacillus sp. NPDC058041 TaxID=3346310 RepID=UPI0036DE97A4
MNIAATINMGNNIAVQPKEQQQIPTQNNQQFGNVFGQILLNQQTQQPVANDSQQNLTQELSSLLNADSLNEVETLLGSKELTVNPKQLKDLLNKLLGEKTETKDDLTESNVWDLLAGISEQASQLTDAIVQSLNGLGTATPVEAKEAVQLLKVVQLIGKKSDLTLNQESTLFDLNHLVDELKEAVSKKGLIASNEIVSSEPKMFTLDQAMKPVVQHVVVKQVTSQTDTIMETKEITTNVQGQASNIVQTKVETITVTLPTEKPAQSEEFVKELQKVMNRVQFGQAGGANRLVIKLYPEQLGTIRIELIQKDGMLTTKMLASTALGKDMLDSHSNQLRQGLVNQNIQVDKLEITQALQDSVRQERNQNFQDSFRQQQQENQENSNDDTEETSTFGDFLKEMEV